MPGVGDFPHILRYIPGYFDIKTAYWLYYSNSKNQLAFVYPHLLKKLVTALPDNRCSTEHPAGLWQPPPPPPNLQILRIDREGWKMMSWRHDIIISIVTFDLSGLFPTKRITAYNNGNTYKNNRKCFNFVTHVNSKQLKIFKILLFRKSVLTRNGKLRQLSGRVDSPIQTLHMK